MIAMPSTRVFSVSPFLCLSNCNKNLSNLINNSSVKLSNRPNHFIRLKCHRKLKVMSEEIIVNRFKYKLLNSSLDPSFWKKLSQLKLNVYRSNDIQENILGYVRLFDYPNVPSKLIEFDHTSVNKNVSHLESYLPIHGKIINNSTFEKFKQCDKQLLINSEGMNFAEDLKSEEFLVNPNKINWFILLTYMDIKYYNYYYWFCFPYPEQPLMKLIDTQNIAEEFSDDMLQEFCKEFRLLDPLQRSFFVVFIKFGMLNLCTLEQALKERIFKNNPNGYFGFINTALPGFLNYQINNFIIFLKHHFPYLQGTNIKLIAVTLGKNGPSLNIKNSVIYEISIIEDANLSYWKGWEKDEKDEMNYRSVNLKSSLEPYFVEELSKDLNLKLMTWNILPNIDLSKIESTKYLLIGAGTLGCSVARTLLGWGVKNITFIDNGIVSHSNPKCQSLYTYQDAVEAKPKALAAADRIKLIAPGVNVRGYILSIPMPGHHVDDSEIGELETVTNQLIDVIECHDVIFLLLDTKESRWLPTLIASAHKKIVINVTLSFDSYWIMRHGVNYEDTSKPSIEEPNNTGLKRIQGSQLGCYFCVDSPIPTNSFKNKSLDQISTVSRAGLSQIAGALATELAISLITHKDGVDAPAFCFPNDHSREIHVEKYNPSQLGIVPHSIRGYLSSYKQFLPATEKFKNCVACSPSIITHLIETKFKYLREVLNDSIILENISRLSGVDKNTSWVSTISNDVYLNEEVSDWDFSKFESTDVEEE